MKLIPVDNEPGVFRALDSAGRSLGKCKKVDGKIVFLGCPERRDKKMKIKAGKRMSGRDPNNVVGAWKRARRKDHTTPGGIEYPSLWPALIMVIRSGPGQDNEDCTRIDGSAAYLARRTFFHFCKKHGIVHKPVERERYPIGGEPWPWSIAIEVNGGPALEKLCGDGVISPWWLLDWYYVVDSSPPVLGSGGVSVHGPRPINKVRGFKWHEAGNDWVSLSIEDLTPDQQMGLGEGTIVNLMGLETRTGTVPYVWLLGCTFPLKWSGEKWVDAYSCADRGRVPRPVLCKEWFGCAYLWYWKRSDGKGGWERSVYFPDASTAKVMLDRGCKWTSEGSVDRSIADYERGLVIEPPDRQSSHFTNSEGWIGK